MSLETTVTASIPTPTSASSLPPLPVILCLHGGGTNATIFNIQTVRLQRALTGHFEFVFLDAPVTSPAGPGVLPFFEGCGPFYRWGDHGSPNLSDQTRKKIAARIREIEEGSGEFEGQGKGKGRREVVGVLGFSQGGRCAAGLVLEQQLGVTSPLKEFKGFRFGVFLNSTSPPLVSKELTEDQRGQKVVLPAVHVIGSEDPWRDDGYKLWKESFDERSACLIELSVGHRLPVKDEDTQRIVREILRVWKEVSGDITVAI
jgi:predicted esterase